MINGFKESYISSLNLTQKRSIEIDIPSIISGKKVVAVAQCAFDMSVVAEGGKGDIKNGAVVEDGVGIYAKCVFIKLNMDNAVNLKTINSCAFRSCIEIKGTLIFPKNLVNIEPYAFERNFKITEISFLNGNTFLDRDVFDYCTSLARAQLPRNISILSTELFYKCAALEFVEFPSTITEIETLAFQYCPLNLSELNFPNLKKLAPKVFQHTKFTKLYLPDDRISPCEYASDCFLNINADAKLIANNKSDFDKFTSSIELHPLGKYLNNMTYNCTISYDNNGFTTKEVIERGREIKRPSSDPSKDGYKFVNYYTDSLRTNLFVFDTAITKDTTIYVLYTVNQYSLTFNSNGGGAVNKITQDFGTVVSKPADPKKDGYAFGGWYTDDTTFNNPYTFTTMGAQDQTLFAKWISKYSVTDTNNQLTITGYNNAYLDSLVGANKSNIEIDIPCTIDGKNVIAVGSDAFKQSKYSGYRFTSITFSGALDSVNLDIGTNAFFGCSGLGGQLVLPLGSKVGQTAFSGCSGFSGALILQKGVTISANAFDGTKFSAIYLPNSGAPTSVYNSSCFDGMTALLICDDYIDYNSYTTLSNLNLVSYMTRLTYEVTIKFVGDSEVSIDDQIKLYNQVYKYTKDETSKVWALDNGYEMPFKIKTGYTLTCCANADCKDSGVACEHEKITKSDKVQLNGQAGVDTVYAKYTVNKYVIQFDGNGGAGNAMDILEMTYDVAMTLPQSTFEKSGYSFGGWNTKVDGTGKSLLIEDTITNELVEDIVNGKVILYAMWAAGKYTINFDANAGGEETTGVVTSKEMTYGEAGALVMSDVDTLFGRVGYTFAGWSTKPTGTKMYEGYQKVSGKDISGAEVSGAIITLYAVWTANTYYVVFDSSGGIGTMDDQPMVYGRKITLNPNKFSKTDYIFVGWSKTLGGMTIDFGDGYQDIFNLSTDAGAEVTLYACWEKMFETSNGTNDTIIITGFNRKYLDSLTGEQKKNLPIKIPSQLDGKRVTGISSDAFSMVKDSRYNGCIFIEIDFSDAVNLESIGASAFADCKGLIFVTIPSTITSIGTSAFRNCDGLTTVILANGVAIYGTDIFNNCTRLAKVTFSYDMIEIPEGMFSGCTSLVGEGGILTIPNKVETLGKNAFKGCSGITGLNIQGTITTYGESAFEQCFNLKGNLDLEQVIHVGAKAFAETKFEFVKLPNMTTNIADTAFLSTNGTMLICASASYEGYKSRLSSNLSQLSYEVEMTFDVKGDIESVIKEIKLFKQSYLYMKTNGKWAKNAEYKLPTPSDVVGHTFEGWHTDNSFNGKKIDVLKDKVDCAILYAKETPIKYDITFDLGDGKTETQQVDYGQKVAKPQEPSRKGYKFEAWCIDSASDVAYDFNEIVTGNKTIYVRWTAISYTIHFDGNGGSGSISDRPTKYDEEFMLPKIGFNRDGYSIIAWTTEADGKGTRYHADKLVKNLMSTDGGNITLYAVWERNQYVVTFETNGGSAIAPILVGHGYDAAMPSSPTKAGYTFADWFADPQLEMPFMFSNVTSNKTAYAKYIVTEYKIIFDANGGNGTMDDIKLVYDEAGKLVENKFQKTGFIFKGWNTKADGTGIFFDDIEEVKNLSSNGLAVKLFAIWEKEQIVVSVVVDTGKVEKFPIMYGTKLSNMPDPLKDGYVFEGWYKDEACTQVYDFESLITEKITIYAKWSKKGLGVGAIVGIAVGSVVGVGGITAGVAVPLILKKKKGGAGKATKA